MLIKFINSFSFYESTVQKKSSKHRIIVKPSLIDLIYKELTLDSSSETHSDMQQRLRLIFQGETGLIPDLRHISPGRPTGMYDTFFSTLEEVIEEYTAADDRRHNEAHMSQILSLKDLISQTKEKCPKTQVFHQLVWFSLFEA